MNALDLCDGAITRIRHTKEHIEESIIDFFVVCDLILPVVTKMTIDSKGELAMTRFKGRVGSTDHKMLKLEIDLTFHKEKHHDRFELFNVRN